MRSLIIQTVQFASARLFPALILALAVPVFTRVLRPDEFGAYAVLVSIASFVGTLSFHWLKYGALRFLGESKAAVDEAALLALVMRQFKNIAAVIGVTAVGGSVIAYQSSGGLDLALRVLVGSVIVVGGAAGEIVTEVARARLDARRYAVIALVRAGLFVGLGAYLSTRMGGWLAPAAALACASWVAAAIGARGWRIRDRNSASMGGPVDARLLARFGLPLALGSALSFVVAFSDRLFLAALSGVTAAGKYSAAYDFVTQTLGVAMLSVTLAAYPLALRSLREDPTNVAARKQLRQNLLLFVLVALPATSGMIAVAEPLGYVAFGPEYADTAVRLIPMIALSTMLWGIRVFYFDQSFFIAMRTWDVVRGNGIAALVNVVLNAALIPTYQEIGAAVATLVAFAVALAWSVVRSRRVFAMPFPISVVVSVLTSSAVMAVLVRSLQVPNTWFGLAMAVAVGVVTYGLIVLAFDVVGLRRMMAHQAMRRFR